MRRRLTEILIDQLTRPLGHYERRGWNDLEALKRHVRPGDVVLVEGDQRISAVIRYITQSSWSHAALYVGDELLRRDESLRAEALGCFGEDAHHMIIEALLDGVVASPLAKYHHLNLRICRAHNLKPSDCQTILDGAVRSLGWRYDLRNIFDLFRYLVPMALHPNTRSAALLGSGTPTEVICTSHLGQLFQAVGFPVAPDVELPDGEDAALSSRPRRLGWLLGRSDGGGHYSGIYRERHPTLLTPRDFDLSPWFDVVKFNVIADRSFDYARIRWADQVKAEALRSIGKDTLDASDEPAPGPDEPRRVAG